jgi:alkaline phosphatase
MKDYRKSAWLFAEELQNKSLEEADLLFKQYYQIRLTNDERETLYKARNYKQSPIPTEKRSSLTLVRSITKILYDRTYIGFTTYGHTGEDVFFAGYHPANDMPTGIIANTDVNHYLCRQLQIENKLPELTEMLFIPHTELFDASFQVRIDSLGEQNYRLTATKKRLKIVAESGDNQLFINDKAMPLRSVIVYMAQNKLFYLPDNLKTWLKTN